MNYSLTDMCDVGAELGRLAAGAEAAEVLLTALSMNRHDVERVARARVDRGTATMIDTAAGDLPHWLSRLVRDEILDWTWQTYNGARWQSTRAEAVGDVYVDALTAVCAAGVLPPSSIARLRAPWDCAGRIVRSLDLGPNTLSVRRLLLRVAALDEVQRSALRAAVDTDADTSGSWVTAGADARSAVAVTARTRPAAAAQLLLVRAYVAGGLPDVDVEGRLWAALSRLVDALVVHDVLPDATSAVLQAFWLRVFVQRLM